MIIDAFAHILPKSFMQILSAQYPTEQLRELAADPNISDLENRVRMLDKFKIDKQVLTLARPSIWLNMPAEILLPMTRAANDTLAAVARQFPDRFIAIGTLPTLTEEFLPEFDRCLAELGMPGIQIFTNIEGKPLDDPAYRSFFAKAHSTRTPLWLHPQLRPEWPQEYLLDKIFYWPVDTTLAQSRLVFSGIMADYPDLRIITHHMGGMIAHFFARIKGCYEIRDSFPQAKFVTLPKDIAEYFRMFYADTVLNGSRNAFACGYEFYGADRIVFASDYPYGPENGERWLKETLSQVRKARLTQAKKAQILGGNLQRLLDKEC